MIGADWAQPPMGTPRPVRVHRHRPAGGAPYWRWHCRWCGDFGGGQDQPDALARALRHCGEHPYHPSSLVPGTRCARPWPVLAVHPPAPISVYEMLVAAQRAR